MAKLAFIGLGVMGYPMAGHLSGAGHDVAVFNRTSAKAQKWAATYKGVTASTPAAAAEGADFVFTCVGNDNDLRSVTLGTEGVFQRMKQGAVLIDHTTTSALVARELYAEAKKRDMDFLDAPISGGQVGAEQGTLTIMVGGDDAVYDRAEPLLKIYGKTLQHIGPNGSGQLTKMVNQICMAATAQGLAEALNFGLKAGLDMNKVLAAIGGGGAASWLLQNRAKTMIEEKFDFGFAVDWIRKDLGICLDEARHTGVTLPVSAVIDQFYADVQNMGGNRWDMSSLIQRLRK